MANFIFISLWGLVVLAGFIGWGNLVARLAGITGEDAPDWGLAAGWGMAAVIALGGALALLGIAYAPVLFAVVLLGVVLFGWGFVKAPSLRPALSGWALALTGLVLAVLLLRYGSYISFSGANCSDDDIAYFTFVTRLLETGTLLEPFSLRRLSAYGGHTVLQSLVMLAGTDVNGFLMDRGIAVIVAFGLTAGFLRRAGMDGAAPYMVALMLTVIMPFPLGNSSSHVTGLAMFLTLFRTLEMTPLAGSPGVPLVKRLWLIGLVAAAASSLKAHFLGVAALTVFIYWLVSVFGAQRGKDIAPGGSHGRSLVHLALSSLVFLAPWMALMARSSGTILFPLFQGNHQAGFAATYSATLSAAELLAFVGRFLITPKVAMLLIPVALYAFRWGSRAGLALYGGSVIMTIVTAATLTYDNTETLHRYVAPFLGAAFIATLSVFLGRFHRPGAAPGPARPALSKGVLKTAAAVFCAMVVLLTPVSLYRDINRLVDHWGGVNLKPEHQRAYEKMQAAIPPGERVLAVIAHPFALDYRRNEIFNIDVPGGVSPAPGMAFFKGPKALKQYLLGQSIRFIAYRDFTNPGGCIYRYDWWKFQARSGHPMWTAQSRYFLDFMKNVEALEKTESVTYRGRVLRVMRLR